MSKRFQSHAAAMQSKLLQNGEGADVGWGRGEPGMDGRGMEVGARGCIVREEGGRREGEDASS